MEKKRVTEWIYELLLTWIGTAAMLLSMCDAFSFTYEVQRLFIWMTVFVILLVTVFLTQRRGRVFLAFGGLVIGESALFLIGGKAFRESVSLVMDSVSVQFRTYLTEGRYAEDVPQTEQTWGLLFFGMLFATIVAFEMAYCKRIRYMLIPAGVAFFLPFLAGRAIGRTTLFFLLIYVLGAVFGKMGVSWNKDKEPGKAAKTGILALLIGGAAYLIGNPLFTEKIQPLMVQNEEAQKSFDAFWDGGIRDAFRKMGMSDWAQGGVGDGSLGKYTGLAQDERVHLKVSAEEKPDKTVYIRGFVGKQYTGNAWKKDRNGAFHLEADDYAIEVEKADNAYMYHSYPSGREIPKEWREEGSSYEESVQDDYLDVPKHTKEAFADVVKRLIRKKPEPVAWEIANLLDETANYSRVPGKTLRGEDFAETFFFEKKEGYCTHFATTATLLFRMKGIPARYVSGYVAKPRAFVRQDDGTYTAEVLGDEAHAWAEIYVSGTGWIPAETTPGYTERETSREVQPVDEKEPPQEADTKAPENTNEAGENREDLQEEKPETTPENDEKDSKESETRKNPKPEKEKSAAIPFALLTAAGFAILIIVFWKKRKKKEKHFKKSGYSERTKWTFYQIYDQLVEEHVIEKDDPLDEAFLRKLKIRIPTLKEEEATKMLDIVYRANYGKEEVEKADYFLVKRVFLLLEKQG